MEPEEIPENRFGGKIKNISSRDLTENEKKVLELGAKLCPVEHDIDRARLQKDLNAGFRNMKLKDFFYPENQDNRDNEEKRI